MADAIYLNFKEQVMNGAHNLATGSIKAVLVDTADYTFAQTHEHLTDVAAAAREETSANLTSVTITSGTLDADNVTFSSTSGDDCEAVILYVDTGTAATSTLICYIDSASGLPASLGGDVTVTWSDSGIFTL